MPGITTPRSSAVSKQTSHSRQTLWEALFGWTSPQASMRMTRSTPSTSLKGETGEKEVYLTSLLNISQHLSCTPERRLGGRRDTVVCQDAHDRLPHGQFSSRLADLQALTTGQKVMLGVCLPGSGSFHISLEPMPPRLELFTSPHLQMQNTLALAPLPKFLRVLNSYLYPPTTPVHSLN